MNTSVDIVAEVKGGTLIDTLSDFRGTHWATLQLLHKLNFVILSLFNTLRFVRAKALVDMLADTL